jgi:hypothetical protein
MVKKVTVDVFDKHGEVLRTVSFEPVAALGEEVAEQFLVQSKDEKPGVRIVLER